ncbi:hypothetical protein ES705_45638 [subsurface metagenome]
MPVEDWHANMAGAHPGYITGDQFDENLKKLKENSCAHGKDRRKSPPREGPALLQGIIICGRFPFEIAGIDSDNGAEFINSILIRYCIKKRYCQMLWMRNYISSNSSLCSHLLY